MRLRTWEIHGGHHWCTRWLLWVLLLLFLLLLLILCWVWRCRRKIISITIVVLIVRSSTRGVIIHGTPHLGYSLSGATNNTSGLGNSVSCIFTNLFISVHGEWGLHRTIHLILRKDWIITVVFICIICIVIVVVIIIRSTWIRFTISNWAIR